MTEDVRVRAHELMREGVAGRNGPQGWVAEDVHGCSQGGTQFLPPARRSNRSSVYSFDGQHVIAPRRRGFLDRRERSQSRVSKRQFAHALFLLRKFDLQGGTGWKVV